MFTIPTKVMKSPISNKGVFTNVEIPKGKIVGLFPHQTKLISESAYQKGQYEGDEIISMTGVRWVGDYFIIGDEITNEEYINHSEDPNLLYHCGILMSLRHVHVEEELTVNYRYFLAQNDVLKFKDSLTDRFVDGLSGIESLKESCEKLIKLLSEITDLT